MNKAEKQRVKEEEVEENRLHRLHVRAEKEQQKRDAAWLKVQRKQDAAPRGMDQDYQEVAYQPRNHDVHDGAAMMDESEDMQLGSGIGRVRVVYTPR